MLICKIDNCDGKVFGRGYCNKHYLRLRKYGDPNAKVRKWNEKLDFDISENGCYEVTSHKLHKGVGYPVLQHYKKSVPAHRKVFEEMFGEIPEGIQVRHKCDNRLCINPEHLELGTFYDNMMDKFERNRQAKGETNGCHVLTEAQVREIKVLIKNDNLSIKEIAKKYNISSSRIYDIRKGKAWKHVFI